ncbi:MAG: tRNA (5-methylaminomethyl-2-thiouridine)(34)-methyltransferase MnmD [Leptospira sp.]|nr:tRNA (5-methylaminomethyl-2-thiouridine)(34)-methyltransferase MnmD [Leptospira sp.]NCS95669.1 tRNA (5-methylaminomethyl-2-thiouridine)(34)-methyltransferase MnmD [Leptospira sp.]
MEIPYSHEFDDIYFSSDGGLLETQYVFIETNDIPQRWIHNKNSIFTICETGFGTGLNFLYTWKLWDTFIKDKPSLCVEGSNQIVNESEDENESADKVEMGNSSLQWLHFISTEAFPLSGSDIYKYLKESSEISEQLGTFLIKYKLYSPGFYRFNFPKSRISLTLLYGDINETLPELIANVDAWFLDGFAPSKNPQMWTETVFQEMARLSRNGTSFSTYTSASLVRKGLKEVGFSVQKKNGFGRKREMCFGLFHKENTSENRIGSENEIGTEEGIGNENTFETEIEFEKILKLKTSENKSNLWNTEFSIAGAGLAGSSLAYALRQRGIPVTVYDPIGIAEEASGNPIGIFYPHLTKYPSKASTFSLSSFYYANQILDELNEDEKSNVISQEGLFYKIDSEDKKLRYKNSLISHSLPEDIAQLVKSEHLGECIFFPKAKSILPRNFVKYLLQDSTFIKENLSILQSISSNANKNIIQNKTTVYCTSYHLKDLETTQDLPIKKVRGQLYFSDDNDPLYSLLEKFENPLCSDSYLAKDNQNRFIIGSTFDEFKTERSWSEEDEGIILKRAFDLIQKKSDNSIQEIIDQRKIRFQEIPKSDTKHSIESNLYRISHRSQSKDRNPIIGNYNGTWIMTALGSRGLVTALLGGEILASLILDEPIPVPKSILDFLSPKRFSKK